MTTVYMLTVVFDNGEYKDFEFSSKKDRFEAYTIATMLDETLRFTFWEMEKGGE